MMAILGPKNSNFSDNPHADKGFWNAFFLVDLNDR